MRRQLLAMAALAPFAARAQAPAGFPNRPVTIISPYAAGGTSDVVTRILANELGQFWGQPVLVVNRGGAGTTIGSLQVARSRPDGYTLLQTSGSYTINPGVRRNMPYDTLRDFTNIALVLLTPHIVVTHTGSPANTMRELIAASRRRDRPFTYASSGVGSASHMTGELIQALTGANWEHVPYNGQSEAAGDVLTGRIDFHISNWSDARPSVQAGQLKALAMGFPTRLDEAPNIPTLIEALPEMTGMPVGGWNAIVGPAGLPPDILAAVTDGIRSVVTSDSYRQRILTAGAFPTPGFVGPEEADRFLRNEMRVWANLVEQSGLRVD